MGVHLAHIDTAFSSPAQYISQEISQYQGNPLIEALPPILEQRELFHFLKNMPTFEPSQRDRPNAVRQQMILQLQRFLVPLPRHVLLAQSLDALIRQGYVGRAPRTKYSHQVFQRLYENQKSRQFFSSASRPCVAQLSSSLIGLPGVGKTTAIRHILARYGKVIHHEELGIFQVPSLQIETPHDGTSTKGLTASIFRKLDELLPDAGLGETYWKGSYSAETLLNNAARVLHMFSVGLLVVDEIQNMTNSSRNSQSLMSLLVTASNELGVPILFVGTNKAQRILERDFRQARRSTGIASEYWGGLTRGTPGEWELFLMCLWRFQWVREPVAFNQSWADLMFHHTQGLPDLAIKLFAGAQVRAIFDGSERITGDLIVDVSHRNMALIHPMVDALRSNDVEALRRYEDISPINLETMLAEIGISFAGRKIAGALVKGSDPEFSTMVSSSLAELGFSQGDAKALSDSVASGAKSAIDGVTKALKTAVSGRPVKQKSRGAEHSCFARYPEGDLRNALNPDLGNNVLERLRAQRSLSDVDSVLNV